MVGGATMCGRAPKVREQQLNQGVLQCVAVCCSELQCVALSCSVLQCVTVCRKEALLLQKRPKTNRKQAVANFQRRPVLGHRIFWTSIFFPLDTDNLTTRGPRNWN